MTVGGGRWPPYLACHWNARPGGTHEFGWCSQFDCVSRQKVRFNGVGARWPRWLRTSLRDAEVVVVTTNTGATGPRLLPRGPPGPKAAPPAVGNMIQLSVSKQMSALRTKIEKLRTAVSSSVSLPMRTCSILFVALIVVSLTTSIAWGQSYSVVSEAVQPKMVKIYGSGGLRGLEAYQSGFLITADGHILTAWSYVLDSEEYLFVVTGDGQKYGAKLINHDPRLEIALLKIEAEDLPFFNMDDIVELQPGARVLAFSNLFGIAAGDEPASIQHGHVMAVTDLAARRGAFQTIYRGPVYVVDAMTNNPGAAGGVLTDTQGRLAGILGKELRNALDNTWLNYAVPIKVLNSSVDDMLAGRNPPRRTDDEAKRPENPHTVFGLGIFLVPDVLAKTPPFVDNVQLDSLADKAGLRPDDLVLFVNDRMVSSCKELDEELSFIDRIDPVRLTVQRGQELLEVEMKP